MNLILQNKKFSNVFTAWQVWYTLAWQDIKLKYKRSKIGPFWLTISMSVTIYSMGILYSYLFRVNITSYLPYLAAGLICWTLISTVLIESTNIFIESEIYIKNAEPDYIIYLMRLIFRNIIIFLHNLIAFVPLYFLYVKFPGISILLIIPGLIVLSINAVFWGTAFAMLGTRFRDMNQIITSLIQVIFFVTPVMWLPKLLPEKIRWIVTLNPFEHFVNLIRNPLLGQPINKYTLIAVILNSIVGFILFKFCLNKYEDNIVFWL